MKVIVAAVLAWITAAQAQKPAPQQPEYYDEPNFVVSGVTDYTYRGGHGSDTVLRSADALTSAAASLKKDTDLPKNAPSAPAQQAHARAEADEKQGDFLNAVREYQRAAELDASESNFFDWGLDLLAHRTPEPAIEVFTKGSRIHPASIRLLLGLAVALYMHGDYEHAAQRFFEASDLHPSDPTPYMFLGQVQANVITQSATYVEKLSRFASLAPDNAWANYYYATALWRQRASRDSFGVTSRVQELLEKSIRLNPSLGQGYLLLGIVYADQKNLPRAISAYRKAIQTAPELEESHYRLSQAYNLSGNKEKARKELELYRQLSKRSAEEFERNHTIQRFVVTLGSQSQ